MVVEQGVGVHASVAALGEGLEGEGVGAGGVADRVPGLGQGAGDWWVGGLGVGNPAVGLEVSLAAGYVIRGLGDVF